MKHRGLIFILAGVSMFGALSIDAYLPALPTIAVVFHCSMAAVQQTLTVYLLALAFTALFCGTLSDSFGRRPVILISLAFFIASSLGASLATNLSTLLFCRLLQGLSAGVGGAVGRAVVGDLFSGAEVQKILSYISIVFGLAPAFAPILGGWLLAAFGWRSIFIFITLFTLILFFTCLFCLPESLPRADRHLFHFKVIVAHYWQVACHGSFLAGTIGTVLAFSGSMLYVASSSIFIIQMLHLTVKDFGWLFIPSMAGVTLGSLISGKLSHHVTSKTTISLGFFIMAVSALANLAYAALFPLKVPWAIIPIVGYNIGLGTGMSAMSALLLGMFPKVRGLTSSLQGFFFMIIFALISGAVAPLVFDSAFKLAAATAIGIGLSFFFWSFCDRYMEDKTSSCKLPTAIQARGVFEATASSLK